MREFTDGSAAIVRGALDAGCTFFAGYPITPASPILMQILRELPNGPCSNQIESAVTNVCNRDPVTYQAHTKRRRAAFRAHLL
jgi:pyruvate/2-oxoacid:ferredoxin oxidoreductase alpha subunit